MLLSISNHDITFFCYSGLLFLIVASDTQAEVKQAENTQTEDHSFQSEKNETHRAYSNITLTYDNHKENFESTILIAERQDTVAVKTSQDDHYHQVRYLYNFHTTRNVKYCNYLNMYNLFIHVILYRRKKLALSLLVLRQSPMIMHKCRIFWQRVLRSSLISLKGEFMYIVHSITTHKVVTLMCTSYFLKY